MKKKLTETLWNMEMTYIGDRIDNYVPEIPMGEEALGYYDKMVEEILAIINKHKWKDLQEYLKQSKHP